MIERKAIVLYTLYFSLIMATIFFVLKSLLGFHNAWWFYVPVTLGIGLFFIYGVNQGMKNTSRKIILNNKTFFTDRYLEDYFTSNAGIFLGAHEFPKACLQLSFFTSVVYFLGPVFSIYALYEDKAIAAILTIIVLVFNWKLNLDTAFYTGNVKQDLERSVRNYYRDYSYEVISVDMCSVLFEQIRGRVYFFYDNDDKYLK